MAKPMHARDLRKLLNSEITWSAGHRNGSDQDMVTGTAWSLGPDAGTLWVQQDDGPMALVRLTSDGWISEVRLAGLNTQTIEKRLANGAVVGGNVVHIPTCPYRLGRWALRYRIGAWAMVDIAKDGFTPCAHCLAE